MKSYSRDQCLEAKAGCEKRRWEKSVVRSSTGDSFEYFVIPQKFIPASLPYAVMRYTTESREDRDVAFFGIAEAFPEKYREFAIAHEILEFLEIGVEHEGRCAQAAEREIALLMASALTAAEKNEYLAMRLKFFQDLVVFALAAPDSFTAEDVEEFRGSLRVFHNYPRLTVVV